MTPYPFSWGIGLLGGKKDPVFMRFSSGKSDTYYGKSDTYYGNRPLLRQSTPITIFSCSPQLLFLAPDVLEGVDRMA